MRKSNTTIRNVDGFTIPEVLMGVVILTVVSVAVMSAYYALISAAASARMRSAALGIATEQLEYLRSLPYDYLALQGGSINSSGLKLPATFERQSGAYTFVATTNIQYVDDAYDGCLTYPASQSYLCRNGPPKSGLPVDTNPRDYKLADVTIREKRSGKEVAKVSTQISARVAETAGNTGALLVTVTSTNGEPIAGATVTVTNSTLSPTILQSNTTDSNGVAIFLDVPPDSGKDFVINAAKTGYSNLSTISASGSLVPTYPNISVIAQTVTSSTLRIDELADDSLRIRTLAASTGSALANQQVTLKGGVKLYTNITDQTYSYSQTITTGVTGEIMLHNLTPGPYYLCYATSQICAPGEYLVVSNSAYGDSVLQPVVIPAGTVSESGSGPMQLVDAYISTSSSHVRLTSIDPTMFSQSADLSAVSIRIKGANLSGSTVILRQGSTNLTTTVLGVDQSSEIQRIVNLAGQSGVWDVVVSNGGSTAVQSGLAPGTIGGINVTP
jgi:type II secretory pathway pseudopilin PulG